MEQTNGPDGYPLSPSDRLHASHLLLNEYLVTNDEDLSRWKKLPKRQMIDLIEAILRRLNWLYEHDAQLQNAHLPRLKLVPLLRILYTRKLPCTEADLRMMLNLTVPLFHAIAPDGPVDYVMEYIKDNDLTPALCESLRNFQTNLQDAGSMMSMQSLRQRSHTLLWMDEWEPLDPARCWSESIRRDFRAMEDERKVQWRGLLKHIRGNAPQLMPPAWAREASERLASVGLDDFSKQLSLWFAPFRSGQPLPLSVAGSHILKGLIWYAAVSGDERAKDASLWLLDVKWKQKRNTEKSMIALGVFGITKEELLSRNLLAKQSSSPQTRITERLLEVFRSPNVATHIAAEPDGDLIIVQGQLHFYRLFRATGRIERATDNAELELNWEAIPDEFRLHLHRECDSAEQLQLRATMLMYDSLNSEYFRVKKR